MMLAVINAELVMPDHLIPQGYLLLNEGKIQEYGRMSRIGSLDGYEIIDAKGAFAAPGFVDIHKHASGNYLFGLEPLQAAKHALANGATTVLPTLAYSMSRETILESIDRIHTAMKDPDGGNIGGIYMEGPYLNPKFGSNRDDISFHGAAVKEEYQEIIDRVGKNVRVWAIAPEREGVYDFVLEAKKVNPNVKFAVAHSEATPQQVEELLPYGLCIGTHHTNATGTITRYPECRGVCVDEAVNYIQDIYAELICDRMGIHVDPYMLRLVRKIKGDDRIILITDSTITEGPIPDVGDYEGAVDINFDFAGEISGTKLNMCNACRNMMVHTGASVVEVFRMGAANPAKAVGLTDRGEIRRGMKADIVIVDDKINVQKVILNGAVVDG